MKTIIETQPNFRDLGGIPTLDGHKLKSGIIYRSGDLHSISDEDILILEKLELALIIDLRARREIEKRPDKRISTVKEIIHIPIHDTARDAAEKYFENTDATALEILLIGDYRRMINDHIDEFRKFFHVLSSTDHFPLVFHCTAGKDRTGLATVFLLFALGVGFSDIWKDYLDTNRYALATTDKIIRKVSKNGKNGEILRPLLEVRETYLNAALEQIEMSYGNLEIFLRNALHVDFSLLRLRFLE